ncbi:LacI family DNA-binding transcriptional regulator [Latilactobacillus fuchuensis]|jgi:DNA-binding LacI/PurR family transcriptional regulator|uniref:LacI family DNA-binding transcriptional regulator n=1 Tax=Latilactobacillus fuchuensis TaxID=164393 RepID=UPI0039B10FF3
MVTISEVAKRAGVSVSTVSRVINDSPHVSNKKKQLILDAMAQLNYQPLLAARQLRGSGSKTIAVTIPYITNPFFSYLIAAIEHTAVDRNYKIIIVQTFGQKQHELNAFELMKNSQVDAVIMCAIENDWEVIQEYRQYGKIGICNEYFDNTELPQVYADQEAGMYIGTKYLLNKGYQKLALCTGQNEFSFKPKGTDLNSDRYRGFLRALREYGLQPESKWLFTNVNTIEESRHTFQRYMEMNDRPDAIIAASDQVAAGMVAEAQQLGIQIPADIGVLGFDDQPISQIVSSPLTTIHQPVDLIGAKIADQIIDALEGKSEENQQTVFPLNLVIRESV